MSFVDTSVASLKVGDQFWAISTGRTPYQVISIKHRQGAHDHVWAEVTASRLIEASKPFDQMRFVMVYIQHSDEIVLTRRIK
jgi:hypothetical protein